MSRRYIQPKALKGTATLAEMTQWVSGFRERHPSCGIDWDGLLKQGREGWQFIGLAVLCLDHLHPSSAAHKPAERLRLEITLNAIRKVSKQEDR